MPTERAEKWTQMKFGATGLDSCPGGHPPLPRWRFVSEGLQMQKKTGKKAFRSITTGLMLDGSKLISGQ